MLKKIVLFLSKLILTYLFTGLVYYLSGTIYNLSIGKDIVFSALIGLPLTLLGWPMMLYADFIHRETLGIKPSFIITLVTIGAVLAYFLWRGIKKRVHKFAVND
jgi:hypothetical protein